MIPIFELPVVTSLIPGETRGPQPDPLSRPEGAEQTFADLLAGLGAGLVGPDAPEAPAESDRLAPDTSLQTGKKLPKPANDGGKDVPDAGFESMVLAPLMPASPPVLALALAMPGPQPDPAVPPNAAHIGAHGAGQGRSQPDLARPGLLPDGAARTDADPAVPQPVASTAGERGGKSASDAPPAVQSVDLANQLPRTIDALVGPAAPRESTPAPGASPGPAPAPVTPGTELELLVEQLAQAREAGRGARAELAVRHAEFGTVAIRLEQAEGETRATLTGRDPGFAPAVVAALAERGATGAFDQQQPQSHQHQRGGDPLMPGGQGDARQPDRRGNQERSGTAPGAANPAPRDNDQPAAGEHRRGRFA